ncbi:hypothetical protein Pth03_21250 [Planotetraspora thailandica]|uniref:Uncharacterized protein n=1 Tax=Planotetraspora thailandica TaxID=487172 RepID=A0A8J3XVI2_9ACTN|nr:hypothetical protein Pth03_21250 [Planotetraspora thailandica]
MCVAGFAEKAFAQHHLDARDGKSREERPPVVSQRAARIEPVNHPRVGEQGRFDRHGLRDHRLILAAVRRAPLLGKTA